MRREPPHVVVAGGFVVMLAAAVMMLWGAWTTGVSWDEPYHVQRLTNFFAHGWYLIDDNLIAGQPHEDVPDTYVYAPVAALLAHLANVVVGNESLHQVAGSPEAIAVRHLTIAVIGMAGTLACAGITRVLTGSWRWAVVAGALLSAMPAWTGHAMFNIKDVPVATGYTLATLGLMLLVRAAQDATSTRRRTLVPGVVVTLAGTVLAVGTRPGIWPGVVAALGIVVLGTLLRRRVRAALVIGGVGSGVLLASWAVLAAVHPEGFRHLHWILGSVSSSASYGGRGSPLYVPKTVLIEVPTVVLLLVLFSFCVWWLSPKQRGLDGGTATLVAVVLAQAVLIPGLATAGGSTFYDGLRQILFSYPAVAVLATLVVRAAVRSTSAGAGSRRLLTAAVLVSLALPTVVQARLFPYNYAFTSELGAAAGLWGRGDYWRTSLRELGPEIPAGEHLVCTPVLGPDERYRRYSPLTYPLSTRANDCRRDAISPVAAYLPASDPSAYPLDSFLEVSTELFGESTNCSVLAEVTRTPYFSPRRLSEVARCELSLASYPAGGIELDGDDDATTTFLLGEWTSRQDRPGVSVLGSTGSVGFTLDEDEAADVTLVFETAGDGEAAVTVNGAAVQPRLTAPGEWHAQVPGALVDALGGNRLVVSWTPEDPAWSLLAVSLEGARP